jgi:hypothetical protein
MTAPLTEAINDLVDTVTDVTHSSRNNHGKLSSGRIKAELVHELAVGEMTKSALAKRYGVTQPAITHFGKRNAALIEKRTNEIMNDYADSLWIARKYDRLGVLQDTAEELLSLDITPRTAEVLDRLLRSAADELGDIPNNSNVNVTANATYEIVGIDTATLM